MSCLQIFRNITENVNVNICLNFVFLSVLHMLSRAMLSNVEIKAKVSDPEEFAKKAAGLSQSEATIIRQHDTFFNCSHGRLKLRDFMVPTEPL